MPRFFCSDITDTEQIILTGENARHISKSLRMQTGEALTVCDGNGRDFNCIIEDFTEDSVILHCEAVQPTVTEPTVKVTLCQGLPKSDKLEQVIQKAVELGVYCIAPFSCKRAVVRLDEKSADKKVVRWNKIALEAAKQSERGIIPTVEKPVSFTELINKYKDKKIILFYEEGGDSLRKLLTDIPEEVVIFIGPEGGFDPEEVALAKNAGADIATLGKRILRTETAPMAALTAIMLQSGNME